jgi:hypothetical protein
MDIAKKNMAPVSYCLEFLSSLPSLSLPSSLSAMSSDNVDEETKTLLLNSDWTSEDGSLDVPMAKVDKSEETWVQKTVSSWTVYVICFSLLALNVGLLGASWWAQGEIQSLYSSVARDIATLPRPDPFAGLSDAAKSLAGGE